MEKPDWNEQRKLVRSALSEASPDLRLRVLDGTIGDAQSFCWAALRQYERRTEPATAGTPMPKVFGLAHADLHLLLVVAQETVTHVERVEQLLRAVGRPVSLRPPASVRQRLREARNLLAEHRDERVLYWRLTGRHTPHVIRTYEGLGLPPPEGSIDSEVIGYGQPPPDATPDEVEAGRASVGTVGGLLALPALHGELIELETELDALAAEYRGAGRHP